MYIVNLHLLIESALNSIKLTVISRCIKFLFSTKSDMTAHFYLYDCMWGIGWAHALQHSFIHLVS